MLVSTYRLRVHGIKVLRGVLGPEKVVVKAGWRKLDNEELHYSAFHHIQLRRLNFMK